MIIPIPSAIMPVIGSMVSNPDLGPRLLSRNRCQLRWSIGRLKQFVDRIARLCRLGRNRLLLVTVSAEDFECRPYKSLSAISRAITGTRWYGLTFFA